MTRYQRPSPVARMLGPAHAQGGPLALLGLDAGNCSPEAVEASLGAV